MAARKPPASREGAWQFDYRRKNHPDVMAQLAAHERDCRNSDHASTGTCTAPIDPAVAADIRAGRRRMAAARQADGRPLDDIDLEVLADPETPPDATP
jgi:hypothetical protein